MGKTPLVSIIMPTHNAARFIGKAIQSVLAQTYQHWELLIVDDASMDHTESIVHAFSDSRIRYHKIPRIGHPAGVRNTALRMAQGDLIAFLDSDDLYFPETLEKLSRPLLENPELISAYGFAFNIDENENALPHSIKLMPATTENSVSGEYNHSWEHIVTSKISCMLPALMLRRSAREQIGFFNENLCGPEDYEFYVRMYLHKHQGVHGLNDYVYQYRIHSASLTKAPAHYQKLLSSCLKIMHWMFNEANIPPHVRSLKSKAYLACYRYLARERLLHHQPAIARQIVYQAFQDRNIHFNDFIAQCAPILIRSFLPAHLDSLLVSLRQTLRQIHHTKAQPA